MSRIHFSWDPDKPGFFRLERDYERQTSRGCITVPQGYDTDLASIPRHLRRQLPQWEDYTGAAIVHDYLYSEQPDGITRQEADDIFHELMRCDGVTLGRADRMHRAVRAYGDIAWRGHQKHRGEVQTA